MDTFLFCRSCNPQGEFDRMRESNTDRRTLEELPPEGLERRQSPGRRRNDGHGWFRGTIKDAVAEGWLQEGEALLCPRCRSWSEGPGV